MDVDHRTQGEDKNPGPGKKKKMDPTQIVLLILAGCIFLWGLHSALYKSFGTGIVAIILAFVLALFTLYFDTIFS